MGLGLVTIILVSSTYKIGLELLIIIFVGVLCRFKSQGMLHHSNMPEDLNLQ